LCELIR